MVTLPPYRHADVPAAADRHCVCAIPQRRQGVPCEQHAIGYPGRGHQLFDAVQLVAFGAPRRLIVHGAV
jgi:hypothetical protein